MTTELTLSGPEDLVTGVAPAVERRFTMSLLDKSFRTIPAAVTGILALFLIAYVKSSLYWLAYGERRVFETTNLCVGGTLVGLAAVILAWIFGGPEPSAQALVACALLGGASGLAVAVAVLRTTQRRSKVSSPGGQAASDG